PSIVSVWQWNLCVTRGSCRPLYTACEPLQRWISSISGARVDGPQDAAVLPGWLQPSTRRTFRMNSHRIRGLVLGLAVVALTAPSLMAQAYEANPYAGAFWPGPSSVTHLKNEGLYGGRFGYFLDPNFELEANVGWITHFNGRDLDVRSRGLLW